MVNRLWVLLLVCCALGAWPASRAHAEQLVDPMRPSEYKAPQPQRPLAQAETDTSSWKLTAVITAADRRVAVVNGRSLQRGDSVDGFTVRNIFSDRVVLQKAERKVVLRRAGTGLKKDIR